MNWVGSEKQKESITEDGYHLIVKYIDDLGYSWKVYYKENLVKNLENQPSFKATIPRAKRQAIRVMVYHMMKKVD